MFIEEVYLLGDGSCGYNGQLVTDEHISGFSVLVGSLGQGDALSLVAVASSSEDKRGMESVDIEVVSSELEAWPYGGISVVKGLEVRPKVG